MMGRGGKNLIILGLISIVVAGTTTGVSLAIYHNTGDIYLDRSRPGYLPDEQEISDENEEKEAYMFEKTDEMTMEALEEYLEELDGVVKTIDKYEDPFAAKALSDEALGI